MSKFKVGDLAEIISDRSVHCGQICKVVEISRLNGISLDAGTYSNGKPKKLQFQNENSLRLHKRAEEIRNEPKEEIYFAAMYSVCVQSEEEIHDINQIKSLTDLCAYMGSDLTSPTDVFVGTMKQIKDHARREMEDNEVLDDEGMVIVVDNKIHLMYSRRELAFIDLEKESV